MSDVIIFQMGKVASWSICTSLRKRGLEVGHSHFLGADLVIQTLVNALKPRPDNLFDKDLTPLCNNIQMTQEILRYKKLKEKKIPVITAARDPLYWYCSHFIENSTQFLPMAKSWASANNKSNDDDYLRSFLSEVFQRLASLKSRFATPEFYEEVAEIRGAGTFPVRRHLHALATPIRWFDRFFEPLLEIDIFGEDFPQDQGYKIYSNDFSRVLLLKYEMLGKTSGIIGDFLDLGNFSLNRANRSLEKDGATIIRDAFSRADISAATMDKVYSTKYCRHFGYEPHEYVFDRTETAIT